MLLAELVATSTSVAATRSRKAKGVLLAELLGLACCYRPARACLPGSLRVREDHTPLEAAFYPIDFYPSWPDDAAL